MASDVFSFQWGVPTHGYKWVEGEVCSVGRRSPPTSLRFDSRRKGRKAWILTDCIPSGQSFEQLPYQPLKNGALFRDFADLTPYDRESILSFANKYGALGIGGSVDVRPPANPAHPLSLWGETLTDWSMHITAMSHTWRMWNMAQDGDIKGLAGHIEWKLAGRIGWSLEDHEEWLGAGSDRNSEWLRRPGRWVYHGGPDLPDGAQPFPTTIELMDGVFRRGDILTPAKMFVGHTINAYLDGHVNARLVYDTDRGRHAMECVPSCLISALWLQFLQAVAGDNEYRACRECGCWYELSSKQAQHRTVRRVFCSDPCKFKDYRRRQGKAGQLEREGMSIKGIAIELDTDAATIKRWLAKK
jgi:hypothetical protein